MGTGRLNGERVGLFLRTLIQPGMLDQVFVCGPHALNEEAETALLAAGVPQDRIHVERFGLPPGQTSGAASAHAARPGDAFLAQVSVVRDGLTRAFSFHKGDPSILDAAAREGLVLPYSCKSGVCATCRAKVLEGQVRMDRNYALEKADIEAGFILTCQAHPLTDRVVVSFDER
jgi:ring-1,2-phenylacetyl-CoA epoxidase subunit PaaE